MNLELVLLIGFVLFLLVLLIGILRDPKRAGSPASPPQNVSERRHVTYFPQLRQAMSQQDLLFLTSRGFDGLARKVRRERRRVAMNYLDCLRGDFLKLWRLARVIASMSPQVGMSQEIARMRLGLLFIVRYELVRAKFYLGFSPLPELGSLSEAVSRLAVRMETAMKELGERAALAAKLASSLDGQNLNTP